MDGFETEIIESHFIGLSAKCYKRIVALGTISESRGNRNDADVR